MQPKSDILSTKFLKEADINLEAGQTVTCSHTFQVKIIDIYEEERMVEFIMLSSGERQLLPISAFKKIVQVLH